MLAKWLWMSVLVSLVGAAEEPADAQKMQGTWTIEAAEKHGEKQPADALKALRAVIKDDTFVFKMGDQEAEKATIKLDPAKTPKAIDFQPASVAGTEKKPSLGIYELKDDTLRLCWRKEGGARPTEFATSADDRDSVLMVLKRERKE
ncbi:MAG TPA: TIGR03067 domain-containing protein [Planctomycetota bacterium]|nr:TIGR03067 domain-containing protein [Planctomycetota bacterium]HRR81758.1 TIGR03067 domain-containing protein [Planctomycetota bacterium]HRT94193.1 TIGR03067 domain-containing protein [Planctomycetota bacterium]